MKLVRAFKKSKQPIEAPPGATTESRLGVSPSLPTVAKVAVTVPQAKPSPLEIRSSTPATFAPPKTTIEALIDVGFGNQLFLRGQGAGLSWERGTPLDCVDGQTWRWSALTTDKLTFKLLLNDKVWAQGEDMVATPGKCIGLVPRF